MLRLLPAVFIVAFAPSAWAQVDQAKIDKAIDTGAEFLMKKYQNWDAQSWNSSLELVMLTLSHANVKRDNPSFQAGLKAMEGAKLQYTYRVAALAMALQRIDSIKYKEKIAHCAQWLVDTQLQDGEWGYPDTLTTADERPKPVEVDPPKLEATSETAKGGGTKAATKIKRSPRIAKNLNLKAKGDISNTQFAILGLKACHDAGLEIPKGTWALALAYMRKTQNKDGGWGYYFNGQMDAQSYSSMTCAGVCSVAICSYAMGLKDPMKIGEVRAGLRWLGEHFKPDENYNITKSRVADPERWLYYYLYSIERVGKIIDIKEIGKNDWYQAGAQFLIDKQRTDGSWYTGVEGEAWKQAGDIHTADTCFAILFLTKATPPLVETGDPTKK